MFKVLLKTAILTTVSNGQSADVWLNKQSSRRMVGLGGPVLQSIVNLFSSHKMLDGILDDIRDDSMFIPDGPYQVSDQCLDAIEDMTIKIDGYGDQMNRQLKKEFNKATGKAALTVPKFSDLQGLNTDPIPDARFQARARAADMNMNDLGAVIANDNAGQVNEAILDMDVDNADNSVWDEWDENVDEFDEEEVSEEVQRAIDREAARTQMIMANLPVEWADCPTGTARNVANDLSDKASNIMGKNGDLRRRLTAMKEYEEDQKPIEELDLNESEKKNLRGLAFRRFGIFGNWWQNRPGFASSLNDAKIKVQRKLTKLNQLLNRERNDFKSGKSKLNGRKGGLRGLEKKIDKLFSKISTKQKNMSKKTANVRKAIQKKREKKLRLLAASEKTARDSDI